MNEAAWLALAADFAADRVAHAYAFYGEEGLGQDEVASAWTASLLCSRPGTGANGTAGVARAGLACGTCPDCQAFSVGAHPDLLAIRPEGASVKIEAIRDALGFAHMRPFQASRRVVIIQAADRLTPDAANALLKVLEEPPRGIVILLLASAPDALLPTVRSRCRSIVFHPVPRSHVVAMLSADGADPAAAMEAAALSGGNPGRARAWLTDPAWPDAARLAREAVLKGPGAPPAEQLAWGDNLAAIAQQGYPLLEWIAVAIRDALAVDDGADPLWLSRADAASLRGRLASDGAERALKALEDARAALRANVSARLTCEVLCLRLARAGRSAG